MQLHIAYFSVFQKGDGYVYPLRAAKDIFGNTALICTVSSDGGNAFGGQQFCFTKLTGTKSWLYLGNTMGMVWDRSIFQ